MEAIFNLINEMSPYLLLGFFLAGIMHAFIPGMVYHRYLGGKGFRSVLYGALLGVPLPLCSCGVIPTAMSLRREGASKGATTSFLIATPETGIDSIVATYSLLGLPFAILRPIAAFCNALLGGWLINRFDKSETSDRERARQSSTPHSADCCCGSSHERTTSLAGKLREALHFGYVEMMQDIGKWLLVGLVVAGLITVLVPDDFFAQFRGNTQLSMLVVLCIAIPMYICATGSIPIAVALMLKGLTPGSALVLLMAGPACNMASILVIKKVMGGKTLFLYLLSIISMAICWGHVVDYLLPSEWFAAGVQSTSCCHEEGASWFGWLCSAILCLLLVNALFVAQRHHHTHDDKHIDEHCITPKQSDMNLYHIEGMNCNHCRASVEKAIRSVENVVSASVDLQRKEARVEGSASAEAICEAVASIGFSCTPL
ncbi:MAG: SO_0444 family Cu/Zn efflux transporter [Bacteroidales bacterium]|nr:SO_0444 family Cu/Zn efflux transporter [Candidatus Physcousia equi]